MSLATPRKGYKSVPWLFGKEIEIPEEWDIVKLEKHISLKHGFAFDSKDFIQSEGVKVIKIKNIENNGKVNISNTDHVAFALANQLDSYLIKENDLVIALTGATLGKVAIVKTKEKLLQNQRVGIFSSNNMSLLDNTFLFFIISDYLQNQIWSLISASAQPNIGKSELDKMKIMLPTLQEQQKIVTILSNVDNLIDSTGKVITHSKKVKTGLMQKLLTRGIGHTKFKKVPWFFGKEIEIPQEWEVKLLSEISEVIDSRHYTPTYKENGLSLILPNNVTELGLNLNNTKYTTIKDYEKLIAGNRKPHEDDIIYTRNASFGVANQVKKNQIFSLGQDLVLIKPKQIVPFLLYLILNSKIIIHQLDRLVSGSTFKRINLELIRSFTILLPSLQEQQKIATILSNIDSKITSQEQYKEKLEKLKKSLMQKLLTGEVRV